MHTHNRLANLVFHSPAHATEIFRALRLSMSSKYLRRWLRRRDLSPHGLEGEADGNTSGRRRVRSGVGSGVRGENSFSQMSVPAFVPRRNQKPS